MTAAAILLALVTIERLGELVLARRNTVRLLAQGAFEVDPGHYPFMVLLHALWLAALWLLGRDQSLRWDWLTLFLLLQGLRIWVLGTLGPRWTTRIIILPGAPLVDSGPYRFFPHPNYLVVIGEIASLPLCLGLPWLALVFSLANGAILFVRIRAENAALAGLRGAPQSQSPKSQ
jgi:methyltransferase